MQNNLPNFRKLVKMLAQILTTVASAQTENDRQFVTALARGLSILSAFEEDTELSHQALCQRTQLPKATVTRLIHTLCQTQFLRFNAQTGLYQLGKHARRFASHALTQFHLFQHAQPLLRQFAQTHQVSVTLATEDGGEMLYLESVRSPAKLAVQLHIGSRVPLAYSAIGRAYYASLPDDVARHALIDRLPIEQRDKQIALLDQAAHAYPQQGYVLVKGDFSYDIIAAAVGLKDFSQPHKHFSLNASAPSSLWSEADYASFIVPKLKQLAADIEQ